MARSLCLSFATAIEGRTPIPATLIAILEGKKHTVKYCAWTFLEAFQADAMRLNIKDWQIGRSRAVMCVYWPDEVKELLGTDCRVANMPRVLFSSGAKWQRGHSAQKRAKARLALSEWLRRQSERTGKTTTPPTA